MPKAKIKTMGCPLLAPMAEEGWTDNKIAELTVKEYLKNIKNVDALNFRMHTLSTISKNHKKEKWGEVLK